MPVDAPDTDTAVCSEFDVIIVGAGPAGSSTALSISLLSPRLAARTLIIDRATFPRHKLCGGGITHKADSLLRQLGVDTVSLSRTAPIDRVLCRLPRKDLEFEEPSLFRVVTREEFDHQLLRTVTSRGIAVHEGEALLGWTQDSQGITVQTSRGRYRTKIVVGADGVHSTVRRLLRPSTSNRTMMALETLLPPASDRPSDSSRTAVFDFRGTGPDFWGYYWEFPAWDATGPRLTAGVIDTRRSPGPGAAPLRTVLLDRMVANGRPTDDIAMRGFPSRWFDSNDRHGWPRILLIGDAAGTDPLWVEGITSALRFGPPAARAVVSAIEADDFSFAGFDRALRRSRVGRALSARRSVATAFYRHRSPAQMLLADWFLQRLTKLWRI